MRVKRPGSGASNGTVGMEMACPDCHGTGRVDCSARIIAALRAVGRIYTDDQGGLTELGDALCRVADELESPMLSPEPADDH